MTIMSLMPMRPGMRGRVVLLFLGREPLALVEDDDLLLGRVLPLPRLRDRRDELGATATLDDPLCRLTMVIQLPMPRRVIVWRVKDRSLKKSLIMLEPLYFASASSSLERRSLSRSSLFSRSRLTVVRPSGVRPMILSFS